MSDDYEVGYGKPPKKTQFKPGQPSANPRGRPRKQDGLPPGTAANIAALKEVLYKPLRTADGKKLMPLTAVVTKLLKKALDGDVAAARELFKLSALIPFRDVEKENIDIEKALDSLFRSSGLGPYSPPDKMKPGDATEGALSATTGDPPEW